MLIGKTYHRSVEVMSNGWSVQIIDQRQLPWKVVFVELTDWRQAEVAIQEMWVRGAPLIGAVAAYGLCLALRHDNSDAGLAKAYEALLATRPTAVNLLWALNRVRQAVINLPPDRRVAAAYICTAAICDEDADLCRSIGEHGLQLIKSIAAKNSGRPINILTHCNAGWLATVDYGTALAPIYLAHQAGVKIHVWVDETRPRNQGSALTAWELTQQGVPHTVITDNAGGILMQQGRVDMCIVGTDRVACNGDVCNKIGTYLKALAASDNNLPFYVALPYSTFDPNMATGDVIPIEERATSEVTTISGRTSKGEIETVTLTTSPAANPAFDVTPVRLVTAFITERGIIKPSEIGNYLTQISA